jgi:hypothetical protein
MTLHPSTRRIPKLKKTTRLDPVQARNHALYAGLLALRLPCATIVSEWNLRILTMLLDQFCDREPEVETKWDNCLWAVNKLIQTMETVVCESKNAAESATHLKMYEVVLEEAKTTRRSFKNMADTDFVRTGYIKALVACVHSLVRLIYGENLVVKKGFRGLIWTVRWA